MGLEGLIKKARAFNKGVIQGAKGRRVVYHVLVAEWDVV
jgi:hypothetical protein